MNVSAAVESDMASQKIEAHERSVRWDYEALIWFTNTALLAVVILSIYTLFFSGPWLAPLVAAGCWLLAEFALRAWNWILRYRLDRLKYKLEQKVAEYEALNARRAWELRASHARELNLDLRIRCKMMVVEELRARAAVLEAERREVLVERGRREERARLEAERTGVEILHLQTLADRLGMRADWLEARLDRGQLMRAVKEFQEAVEDRIQQAYERGFVHGARGVSFASPPHPHLTLVNPSA